MGECDLAWAAPGWTLLCLGCVAEGIAKLCTETRLAVLPDSRPKHESVASVAITESFALQRVLMS